MKRLIEVVIEDKELDKRIVVAQFEKEISLFDRFPDELAKELYKFLVEKSGKFMGKPRKNFINMIFFSKPLNEKPLKIKKKNSVKIKK